VCTVCVSSIFARKIVRYVHEVEFPRELPSVLHLLDRGFSPRTKLSAIGKARIIF
jgi:hypothetical protein